MLKVKETKHLRKARKIVASFLIGKADTESLDQAKVLAEINVTNIINALAKVKGDSALNKIGYYIIVKYEISKIDTPF